MRFVVVAVAGAAGALTRYSIGQLVGTRAFPWATFGINVTGSFALGLFLTLAAARGWSPDLIAGVGGGFLGAYTTYSTFTFDAVDLAHGDRLLAAAAYVVASVVVGLAAAALGWRLGRAWA